MEEAFDNELGQHLLSSELGRLVRIRRKHLGMTVEQAVRASGLSRSSWQGIEHARSTSPRNATLRAIDGALRWRPGTSKRILTAEIDEPGPADLADADVSPYSTGAGLYVEPKEWTPAEGDLKAHIVGRLDRMSNDDLRLVLALIERLTAPATWGGGKSLDENLVRTIWANLGDLQHQVDEAVKLASEQLRERTDFRDRERA